ncbi:hypothetical protein PREVCOP_06875 [Segatella copri DSM 18205]|uniref:Uncharacterized protein n=1 Tax=Segatella copri DSM 18205 TaxID=537011 RepID=D1PHZ8_9BACT|nr:hypothetical protein PREVCOP_06875 [Segatella copri DSM 18205]
MWAVRVQIIGLPALLLFGTRFFFIQYFQGNTDTILGNYVA